MSRNYFFFIVLVAIGCLVLIFVSLGKDIDTPLTKDPLIPPPYSPYEANISGAGVVEASSDNIYIGSPLSRVINRIYVKVGSHVKKDDVLFSLEDKDLQANLLVEKAAYKSAVAKFNRLKAFPRPEDLAMAEASVRNAAVELESAKNQYEMILKLPDPRAISEEEKQRRRFNYEASQAKMEQVQADADKIKAGTWKPDLEISQLEIQQAKANVERIQAEIQRTVIRSPIEGTVLQIQVHEGEFPPQDSLRMPIMILGNIDELYLRVSINQFDIPSFSATASAIAFLQGNSKVSFPLEFVRVEPLLVKKSNLTNDITEQVDTRVLQVIYRIKKEAERVYVGQQMDVFIEKK